MRYTRWALAGLVVLGLVNTAAAQSGVNIKVGKDAVEFFAGGELVTRYHTAGYAKPIFWPVYAPGKVPLTRAWPIDKNVETDSKDHVHQQSAWFVYGDVIPEGVELKHKIRGVEGVDFWSLAPGHGSIVVTKVGEPRVTSGAAAITTQNEWRTADGQKVLDETRTIHFTTLGSARLIILDIDLHASAVPITFGDTKEGAMGIRINDQIRADKLGKGRIQNAEGKVGEKECWGQVSAWCDYSGPLEGKTVGLTLLDDPKNPHPACWHVRGYGLMAANPFGRTRAAFPGAEGRPELVRLAKGDHLRLRYGMLLHEGDADSGRVAEHYRRFVELRGK